MQCRFENISFRRPDGSLAIQENDSVMVQALIFDVEDRDTIGGSAYGGQRTVCCTPDLARLGVCVQDTIIYHSSPTNPDWPKVFGVTFKGYELVGTLAPKTIQITRTGMYNLYFVHCDQRLDGLTINGKTVWGNPGGYLPGRMAPLMTFYWFMFLAFVILGIYWFFQYAKFWKEVLPLQNCITFVIVLSGSEILLRYLEFSGFNKHGVRPIWFTVLVITFASIKQTISRLLILALSMGYGVVRPTLGGLTPKAVVLGAIFFLACQVLELVENVGAITISELSGKVRFLIVLPVVILDAVFIIWIFTSLSTTHNKLQVPRYCCDVCVLVTKRKQMRIVNDNR